MFGHSLTMTTPDNPAYENKPSDWNAPHVQHLTISGNTAGQSTFSGTNLVLQGGPNATLSINGNTLVISGGAGAAGNTGYFEDGAGTTASLGTILLSNASGVSFGIDGQTLTASVKTAYAGLGETVTTVAGTDLGLTVNSDGVSIAHPAWLTTARASNDAVGLNSALTANGVAWTVNSSGISLNVPAFLTTAALSNHSHGNPTLALTNLTGTTASASNGLTLSLSAAAQTAQSAIEGLGVSNVGNTAGDTGVVTGVDFVLAGSGSITLSQATAAASRTIHIQHPAWLTTAALSDHSHGNPTLALTNLTGTTASASNGFTLSLSANDPGAAAENNWHHALGANTAGNTTASGSTIGLSGINLTISGTNDSVLNLSVPPTSSLVGENNVQISTNGSTITVRNYYQSYVELVDGLVVGTTALAVAGASSVSVQPFDLPFPISASYVRIPVSIAHIQTSSGTTANRTFSFQQFDTWRVGFYSLGVGANSRSLQYVAGSDVGVTISKIYQVGAASNNQSCSMSMSIPSEGATIQYTTSFTVNSASMVVHTTVLNNSIVGNKWIDVPFASSLSAGPWWIAVQRSSTTGSTTAGGNWAQYTAIVQNVSAYGMTQVNLPILPWGVNTTASTGAAWQQGQGVWTTNTNGFTSSSMALSHIVSTASHPQIPYLIVRQA